MKVSPKAAIQPYIASAVAAPIPDTSPTHLPKLNVRLIHKIPIGPTGAAIANPMISPLYR